MYPAILYCFFNVQNRGWCRLRPGHLFPVFLFPPEWAAHPLLKEKASTTAQTRADRSTAPSGQQWGVNTFPRCVAHKDGGSIGTSCHPDQINCPHVHPSSVYLSLFLFVCSDPLHVQSHRRHTDTRNDLSAR